MKVNLTRSLRSYPVIMILFILVSLNVNAQYYPSPKPVPQQKLDQLLKELKSAKTDQVKIPLLLNLSNLYFSKVFRNDDDVIKAINYAKQASTLSIAAHNFNGFNSAQLRLADILSDQNKMDAAEALLKTVDDTTRLDMLIMLGYKCYQNCTDITDRVYKIGLENLNEAQTLAVKLHNKNRELWAKAMYANSYMFYEPKKAEVIFDQLIKDYEQLKLKHPPYLDVFLGRFYTVNGNDDKSLATALKGIEELRRSKDTLLLADFMYLAAIVCSADSRHLESINYCEQAIAHFKIYRGEDDFFSVARLKAKGLQHLKKDNEALAYMIKSMHDYPPKDNSERNKYLLVIGKAYEELANYKMAEQYLLKAYNNLQKDNSANVDDQRSMAEFYVRTKQFEKARSYINQFFMHKGIVGMGITGHVEYMAYMVDSAAGNYKAAMAHLAKNKWLDNQMLSEKKNKALADLSVKYETAKKDGQISLLTQKAKYEAANAKQANLVKNLSFAGIFFVLVIAGLLYRQNIIKQKNNEVITLKNELLERLLAEREWLLKEVHHRVKNNLHTVICLLESQAAYLDNDALKAIENSQHRIYAMSLIHQKLYQSEDIKTIDMDVYLKEFIQYLGDSFGNPHNVRLDLDIEPIKLGVAQAIPIGLIINEAITNAYKYAFPDHAEGLIKVMLHQSENLIDLMISDNGVGMSVTESTEEATSLGMELIKGLSGDLDGKLKLTGKNGTTIRILFQINLLDNLVINPVLSAIS